MNRFCKPFGVSSAAFVLAFLLLLSFLGCTFKAQNVPTLVIANGTERVSLNPLKITNRAGERLYTALFEGLVTLDPFTGDAVSALAESWEFSGDFRRITFTLRDAKWSDGKPITAQTVADSWLYALKQNPRGAYTHLMTELIEGAFLYSQDPTDPATVAVRAVDARTLSVDFTRPRADALKFMAHSAFAVLPMHIIAERGDDWETNGELVSNGPYTFTMKDNAGAITVSANKNYWNKTNVLLKRITFLPRGADDDTYRRYCNGEIDWITDISPKDAARFSMDSSLVRSPALVSHYYSLNMNNEVLADPLIRRALSLAIDREALVRDVLRGNAEVAYNLVPPMNGWLSADSTKFDVEQANKLLTDSGYEGGQKFPTLTIVYNDDGTHKAVAEFVASELRRNLKIPVVTQAEEWESFLQKRRGNGYDIARAAWQSTCADPAPFLQSLVSTDYNNDGRYANAAFDALLRKAAHTGEKQARYALLSQAESLALADEQAVLPLYFDVSYDLFNSAKWDGWYSSPCMYSLAALSLCEEIIEP